MKNELNIENVVTLLKSLSITIDKNIYYHSSNIKNYNDTLNTFLTYFFGKYTIKTIKTIKTIDSHIYGNGICLLNSEVLNLYVSGMTKLEFDSFFPNCIIKLYENGSLNFNINEFPILYKFLIQNKKDILSNSRMNEQSCRLLRFFINYTYCALHSYFSFIHSDNVNIVDYYRGNLINLYDNNPKKVISIDTDVIYFDYLTNDMLTKYIDPLDIPYSISTGWNGVFFQKHKYLICQGNFDHNGFKKYDSEFQLLKNRAKKIEIIRNKLK